MIFELLLLFSSFLDILIDLSGEFYSSFDRSAYRETPVQSFQSRSSNPVYIISSLFERLYS